MAYQGILCETGGQTTTITFDRPDVMNAARGGPAHREGGMRAHHDTRDGPFLPEPFAPKSRAPAR